MSANRRSRCLITTTSQDTVWDKRSVPFQQEGGHVTIRQVNRLDKMPSMCIACHAYSSHETAGIHDSLWKMTCHRGKHKPHKQDDSGSDNVQAIDVSAHYTARPRSFAVLLHATTNVASPQHHQLDKKHPADHNHAARPSSICCPFYGRTCLHDPSSQYQYIPSKMRARVQ